MYAPAHGLSMHLRHVVQMSVQGMHPFHLYFSHKSKYGIKGKQDVLQQYFSHIEPVEW